MARFFQLGGQAAHLLGASGSDATRPRQRQGFAAPAANRHPAAAFPSLEVEAELPARLDQPVALPQQNLLALDDDRQLGQRPGHAGQTAGPGRPASFRSPAAKRPPPTVAPAAARSPPPESRNTAAAALRRPARSAPADASGESPPAARRATRPAWPAYRADGCRARGSTSPSRCQSCVSVMISSVPASTAWRKRSSSHRSGALLVRQRAALLRRGRRGWPRRRAVPARSPRGGGPIARPRGGHAGQPADEREAFSLQKLGRIARILGHSMTSRTARMVQTADCSGIAANCQEPHGGPLSLRERDRVRGTAEGPSTSLRPAAGRQQQSQRESWRTACCGNSPHPDPLPEGEGDRSAKPVTSAITPGRDRSERETCSGTPAAIPLTLALSQGGRGDRFHFGFIAGSAGVGTIGSAIVSPQALTGTRQQTVRGTVQV